MSGLHELINLIGRDKLSTDKVSEKYKNNSYYINIKKFYREKKFTTKDTGVSYRVINNWKHEKILPDSCLDGENQEWTKFNLIELLWIKITNDLRSFGFSLKKIKRTKEHVLKWDQEHKAYLDFEYKLFIAVTTDLDLFLIVDSSGYASIQSIDFIIFTKNFLNKTQMNLPKIILISIKDLIKDYVFLMEPPRDILTVSKPEVDLLKKIRLENAKKIIVETKNKEIFEIQTSNIFSENPNIPNIIDKLKKDETYGEMILHLHKGKAESVEVKKRKRF
jgi:hypothetical protein